MAEILEALEAIPTNERRALDLARDGRAAARRASYSGSVVKLGEDKPMLYAGKSPLERLALQTALVHRLAALGGVEPVAIPRADWPGEVFDIDERNAKLR